MVDIEERAKHFQAGIAGNHTGPQIVHWTGDDITHVALFRREADRDYVLKVLAERPAIVARLEAAQRLQQVSAGEPRWLIETSALSKNGPPRHFWDGKGWTWKALDAARYSSKQIAEHIVEADYKTYLLGSVHRKDIDVCEHLFQCGITPLAAFDKETE